MKKTLKLIPAIAMLLISAVLVSTSTYAWFSMNTIVNATNMQVKAVAEEGLLINEVSTYNSSSWDNAAMTNQTTGILLRATSTADTKNWYTANSTKASSAAQASAGSASSDLVSGYTQLTSLSEEATAANAGTTAAYTVYYKDSNNDNNYNNGEGYYVKYTYYLKSSSEGISCSAAANAMNLNIKAVTATPTHSSGYGSGNLDKALRVAVVVGTKAYIFAPLYNDAVSYYVNAAAEANKTTTLTGSQSTGTFTIPAATENGAAVYVYIYFEGEDTNLKTDNIVAELDNITVEVQFELKSNGTSAATDNGVTIPTN